MPRSTPRPRTLVHGGARVTFDLAGLPRDATLLDAVRGPLGVRSAVRGCATGQCGSCRVLVEGEPVNACITPLSDVSDGARVEAYEDVAESPAAVAAVTAFLKERPTRCTLCVASLGVTAESLARHARSGEADAIDAALATAACMCTGRGSLRRALLAVPARDDRATRR